MTRRARLVAQGVAVGIVVLLFALLAWNLVEDEGGAVASAVARGESPEAPDFTGSRLTRDEELTLSSLRGKAVVLNFFASWCIPACYDEAPELERTWVENRERGVVVLGVAWHDFRGEARRFLRENGITFPSVFDGDGAIGDRYGVRALPETYVLDRQGRVVDALIGSINTDEDRARLREAVERALES
jgi:cytochrome c biogenesis protein CcmG/thiol:disulfide interchange protein DsbE